jgi:hypothetical protein
MYHWLLLSLNIKNSIKLNGLLYPPKSDYDKYECNTLKMN